MTALNSSATDLSERISYRHRYFDSPEELLSEILSKSVVPYQVEVQPGRIKGKKICWMECPYCYGLSSENTDERLTPDRYLELMHQMANGPNGNVHKIIFAGYATDPLNYEHIDDIVEAAISNRQIVGFHSKLLKVSNRLVDLMTSVKTPQTSYLTVSVDAGSSESYNETHDLTRSSNVYPRVLRNIKRITEQRKSNGTQLDIAANYLITRVNCSSKEITDGIENLISAGVDAIRFSFPQLPRGTETVDGTIMPTRAEVEEIYNRILPIVESYKSASTNVILMDYDRDNQIDLRRTLPCFARFIYPAISYDGYLSNCSQSGAAHFKNMALGNLQHRDFWDAFYDYDASDFWGFLDRQHDKMIANDCRCDRKEHTTNRMFRDLYETKTGAALR